jgi:hypothetical protein
MSHDTHVPSPDEVAAALQPFSDAQLHRLASRSGVSYFTLLKIRQGQTEDPRIGTVSQFWPHLPLVAQREAA